MSSRDFSSVQRVLVKIGTSTLSKGDKLDTTYIEDISRQIADLVQQGLQIVLVSSGAIGAGKDVLSIRGRIHDVKVRQACAAIGQPILMTYYRNAFVFHDIITAQVLLTRAVLENRNSFLTLRDSLETLLSMPGILPILNENDSVSTFEIGETFGDNDILSGMIASKIDADMLILLTDIDCLYTGDPNRHVKVQPVSVVEDITPEIWQLAGPSRGDKGSGGMRSKLQAARIARKAGCTTVMANGREKGVLRRLMQGEDIGTVFLPGVRISSRKRWILQATPRGRIDIDEGAVKAIRRKNSLLLKGVCAVSGIFEVGAVIQVNDIAKLITTLSSKELESLIGQHSSQSARDLGNNRKLVARPDEIVFLDG